MQRLEKVATPATAFTEVVVPEQKEPEPDLIEAVIEAVDDVTVWLLESCTLTTMFAKVAAFEVSTGCEVTLNLEAVPSATCDVALLVADAFGEMPLLTVIVTLM